ANTYLSEHVAWQATNGLRLDMLDHLLGLDLSFHKAHTPGELLERIDGDVKALALFFSRFTVFFIGNLLLMLGILVLLWREHWGVGLAATVIMFLSFWLMVKVRSLAIPHHEALRGAEAEMNGFAMELFESTEDVRANGAVDYALRRFDCFSQQWFRTRQRAYQIGGLLWPLNIQAYAIRTAILFLICYGLWQSGAYTLGSIYLIFFYSDLLSRPLSEIRHQVEVLQQAEASISRIQKLLATESQLPDTGTGRLPSGPLSLSVRDLQFHYHDDPTLVLDGVNLELPAGRVLGLLGRTGSGKTSLARLLLRLYDPTGGAIQLGGIAPDAVPLAQLHQRVSMVTQDVQLFDASVRDNLTFFNPAIADDAILAVIEELGLGEWLRNLPGAGLDSHLSGGQNLSAGQAQLLAFARIFLTDPGLVILDEASSRLDPATEQLIERAVDQLLRNRTGIIIAHHLATVSRADDILILDGGRVLEYGDRVALQANPDSHFSHLLQVGIEEVLA
ncbi:MAG: ABC transporter ATP-binding protein, partial [Anaerolineales bacterium]|nr:ABC transporter ATP-binding protein [Anaerolineales bacterium]